METIQSTHAAHVIDAPLSVATVESIDNEMVLPDIDRRLLKIRPMATPVDQISRAARARTSASMEVSYYSVDTRPSEESVSSVVLEGGDYTIALSNRSGKSSFSCTDTVLLTGPLAAGKPHTFYITAVGSGTLTATYIGPDATFTAGTGDGESKIIRMGRAASELDVQTPQTTFVPNQCSNYCQIFKAQVEQGALLTSGLTKADLSFTDQQEAALIDMRMGMERTFLFGSPKKVATSNGNVYFTQGIWHQAGREYALPATLDAAGFVELCRQAFTGQGGSSRKVLIGGSQCIKALVSPAPDATVKSVASVETEVHWGLNLKVISSNFGTLYVVHSETFDLCGHASDGMIIDPEYLQKYTHIPFSALRLDLKKSGQRNTDAVVLTEASCLVLRYPEAHMRLVASA